MFRLAMMVFSLSLVLWVALAVVGGVAAAAIFPAARELPLSMDGYAPFIAAEPVLGRQLVAGFLVERVFDLAQRVRPVVAVIAVAAFILQLVWAHRMHRVEPLRGLRIAAISCASIALLLSFFAFAAFQGVDRKYRALAYQERSVAEAIATKPYVDDAHTFASRVATGEVLALLALVGLTAAAAAGPAGGSRRA